MACIARQRAPQHIEMLARRRHAAAAGLRKRDHAIDIGIGCQPFRGEMRGNLPDHRRRAIDRRQDADEIARAHAAIGAHKAVERGALRLGHVVDRAHVLAERRVAIEIDQRQVVRMHVLAGHDIARGHADHGIELAHQRARGNGAGRDLVAGRHLRAHAHRGFGKLLAQRQFMPGDQHVVVGVQADDGIGLHLGFAVLDGWWCHCAQLCCSSSLSFRRLIRSVSCA
ncbi:hypothetical protein D3C81_1441580 [compost metagenome]